MKRKSSKILLIILLLGLLGFVYYKIQAEKYTIYLNPSGPKGEISSEISPKQSPIRVEADSDTNVIFTDVETGQIYEIGYLTSGITEKINLEKDHWYKVEAQAGIRIYGAVARIE